MFTCVQRTSQNFAVSPNYHFLRLVHCRRFANKFRNMFQLSLLCFWGSRHILVLVCVCVCSMNTQMQKKNKKNSFSPTGHMNMALSKAVLPCILKATGRWSRCSMDFCNISLHSAVSWANNLKCINHPMNVSSFPAHEKSTSKSHLQQRVLALKIY